MVMNIIVDDLKQIIDVHQLETRELNTELSHPLRIYQSPQSDIERVRENQLLQWNAIPVTSEGKIKQTYRLFICQDSCFALFQLSSRKGNGKPLLFSDRQEKLKWIKSNHLSNAREIKKSIQLAIRALYILGYDLGMVEVNISRQAPRYAVTKLASIPVGSSTIETLVVEACREAQLKSKQTVVAEPILGADIEFILRHRNGKYLLASSYFSKTGKVGYDSVKLRGKQNRSKYPIAELRPAPSSSPRELTINIYRCMQSAIKIINNPQIEWLAGGQPLNRYPIGGHIHFSQVPLSLQLIRALDNYLTLPLFLLESKESRSRRPKYGLIGDYRPQFHGGFEYRTPPSWIISPTITKGVLALAKVIACDYRQLTWMPFDYFEIQEAFYQEDRERIFPIVQELWQELRRCPKYADYQQYLDPFYALVKKGNVWNEFNDIRKPWRLAPYHRLSKANML